jgi:hypothetical protein
VIAVPNGAGGLADTGNLNNTFLRGIQKSNHDGVVQFQSLFPGHYATRAVHIHIMVHINQTVHPNGTLMASTSNHVGQMYFDQGLINEIRKVPPYSTNQQILVPNGDDRILQQDLNASTADPFMEYVLLGDHVQDGILAWLSFGVNTTFSRKVQAAASIFREGGVLNTANGAAKGGLFPGGFPTEYEPAGGLPPSLIPGFPGFPSGLPGGPPGAPPVGPPAPAVTVPPVL